MGTGARKSQRKSQISRVFAPVGIASVLGSGFPVDLGFCGLGLAPAPILAALELI